MAEIEEIGPYLLTDRLGSGGMAEVWSDRSGDWCLCPIRYKTNSASAGKGLAVRRECFVMQARNALHCTTPILSEFSILENTTASYLWQWNTLRVRHVPGFFVMLPPRVDAFL